MYESCSINF